MSAFSAFTKKEFVESFRTYRLVILAAVFLLLGIMSPAFAKLLPALLNGTDLGNGVALTMPEPTALDSWQQFFKNVGQMGMLALIIVFCGIMANEFSRGTLINLLTKGMKRRTVILSKFLAGSVIWLVCYLLCLAVCWAYTAYYWPSGEMSNVFLSFLAPWLFGEFLIALLILGGTLFGSFYGSLLTCGGVVIVLNVIDVIPKAQKYNPIILGGGTLDLLTAQKTAADFNVAFIICAAAIVVVMVLAIAVFNKKQI